MNMNPNAAQPKSRRRWYWYSVPALLIVVAAVAIARPALMWQRPPQRDESSGVVYNALVGTLEGQIVAKYGKVSSDQSGYAALGLRHPQTLPSEPVRTLIFDHARGGTLWVWVRKRGTDWECFESCWFKDGVVF